MAYARRYNPVGGGEQKVLGPNGKEQTYAGGIVNGAPREWKSSPDHPKAHLAYVTDKEADILKDEDIYDSNLTKNKHFGPEGVPSYQGDGGGGGDGASDGGASSDGAAEGGATAADAAAAAANSSSSSEGGAPGGSDTAVDAGVVGGAVSSNSDNDGMLSGLDSPMSQSQVDAHNEAVTNAVSTQSNTNAIANAIVNAGRGIALGPVGMLGGLAMMAMNAIHGPPTEGPTESGGEDGSPTNNSVAATGAPNGSVGIVARQLGMAGAPLPNPPLVKPSGEEVLYTQDGKPVVVRNGIIGNAVGP